MACSGVDGKTILTERVDLTAMKQTLPFTGTKQHHLSFSLHYHETR